MPITEEDSFFTENIVNINKKINKILFHASMVPIIFVILTYAGVWYVPTGYAIMVFVYTQLVASIGRLLNRSKKKNVQYVSMYLNLIAMHSDCP
jgi:hypothetical protein